MAKAANLANPGRLSNHARLRREAAYAISMCEVAVARGTDPERAFTDLRAFFTSCISAVNSVAPVYLVNAAAAPTSIAANNTATSTITATVTKNGAPAQGETVTFAKTGAAAATCTLSATTGTTDANGQCTITVKGTAAGVCTVTASTRGKAGGANVTLT